MSTGGFGLADAALAAEPGTFDLAAMGEATAAEPVAAAPSYFNFTRDLRPNSPLYAQLKSRITARIQLAVKENEKHHKRWADSEERVLAYLPETDADSLRRSRRERGEPTYTTIQIPYTFAQVMAAHTYWTTVFLSRTPVHQFSGREDEGEMQINAMEALIGYQMDVGRATVPYFLWFYDAAKYGVGWLGSYWCEEQVQYSTIERQPDGSLVQVTRRVEGFTGNRVYNISPYDALPDPRVTVTEFQKGEFFGVRSRIMWSEIVRRAKRGMYTNLDRIRTQRDGQKASTYGSSQLERPSSDFVVDNQSQLPHPAVVPVIELYVDLLPEEWGLGPTDFPEKWVFTITEDLEVLLGAQPLGLMHGEFPVDVLSSEVEGYAMYNRGIPEIQAPIQNTMDWLINSHMYSVRATLNNGYIIDPTKIVMKDVEKGGPGFVWRLRPEAYGQPIGNYYEQVKITDVTQAHMGDLQTMFGIGERIFGINDQMLGMLAQGGRKTATEVRTSTGFGVNRLKTIAEWMSASGFSSHSQKLVQSSQQFYSAKKKLRIVGNLAGMAGPRFVNVTPEDIVGSYATVPVDGTLPIDRFAQATFWREMFADVAQMPMIAQQYDLGGIFAWIAQLGGMRGLDRFKIQVADPAMLAGAAAAGNVVPIRSGGAMNVGAASAGGSAAATAQGV